MREDISSDNQETHEEVKRKDIDDISTENIITSPDIQEENCKFNDYILNFNYLSYFQLMKIMLKQLLPMMILSTHLIHGYKNKKIVRFIIMYLFISDNILHVKYHVMYYALCKGLVFLVIYQ